MRAVTLVSPGRAVSSPARVGNQCAWVEPESLLGGDTVNVSFCHLPRPVGERAGGKFTTPVVILTRIRDW